MLNYILLINFFIFFKNSNQLLSIPNGLIGNAEIECTKDSIKIQFITKEIFLGRVFVVGYANDTNCVSRITGKKQTSITIKKDKCGVVKIRSSNPLGLFINVKVIISFHDEFITKVDKGYEISCFYMETSKKVTFPIFVSPYTLEPFTHIAAMPRCKYEVLDPKTRKPVSVVTVNNKLLHKWSCESEEPNFWCMTVNTCFVEDGQGTQSKILDEKGCAFDPFLLGNLKYGPGLLQAETEALAFKFPDKTIINLQCSIRLDIKDGKCPTPKCPNLPRTRLNKRSFKEINNSKVYEDTLYSAYTEIDVRAAQIDVLDPQYYFGSNKEEFLYQLTDFSNQKNMIVCQNDCISLKSLLMPLSFGATLIILLLTVVIYLIFKSKT